MTYLPNKGPSAKKLRLDQALVESGLCPSRAKAQAAILAGQVQVDHQRVDKPGTRVKVQAQLALEAPDRYVSRGGYKLEYALEFFKIRVQGVVAIDLGASTGGFTDCLLQHGAAQVYAVDVGRGQLAWKLRRDPRVVVMEKINARTLSAGQFPPSFLPANLIVIDCSFISLRQILPRALAFLQPAGKIVALIKPQFEAGKREADRGAGVITDPHVHQRVIDELQSFVHTQTTLTWLGLIASPLLGPAGNKEFFVHLEKTP